jgi:thiol-disulfide isomerase/thioredoxin
MTRILIPLLFLSWALPSLAKNTRVPASSFKPMTKKEHSKSIEDFDQVFVLFWATWCTNCKDKLKSTLPKLQKQFPNIGFFAINIDQDRRRANKYMKKYDVQKIKHYLNKKLVKKLKVTQFPSWAYMDQKNGQFKVNQYKVGFKLRQIKKMLKKN